jgi:methylmalonyl-CoA/ethylmalonyl-CoA epimerase
MTSSHTDGDASREALGNLSFHHLGVACERIVAEAQTWRALGYRPEGEPFVDAAQGIRGQFMTGGGPRIELLEATPGSDVLAPWLKRRVKIYHVGYLVLSLQAAIDEMSATHGATLAREPLMSVYFQAPIAFLMMPNLALVELIEARA